MNPGSPSMPDLISAWRRESILWPDGRCDTQTTVYWLQASRFYADIRIPAGRPSFCGVGALEQCSPPQLAWLAEQQGFAGELRCVNGAFQWERHLDFQPPSGKRDIGRLDFVDLEHNRLRELGVDEMYEEIWLRQQSPTAGLGQVVLRLRTAAGQPRGLFVAVGEHFLLAVDRRPPQLLKPAPRLADLLSATPVPDRHRLLDMELSLGTRTREGRLLTIIRSTLPWRQGQPAFTRLIAPSPADQAVVEHTAGGKTHTWDVLEGTPEAIAQLAPADQRAVT